MSKSEGFATVCLEAMASGLAVVSSKVGGFSDAVVNGENGYLVEQDDYVDLARRTISLLDNPTLLAEMGRKARMTAENEYDWETVIIPKYQRIYNSFSSK